MDSTGEFFLDAEPAVSDKVDDEKSLELQHNEEDPDAEEDENGVMEDGNIFVDIREFLKYCFCDVT